MYIYVCIYMIYICMYILYIYDIYMYIYICMYILYIYDIYIYTYKSLTDSRKNKNLIIILLLSLFLICRFMNPLTFGDYPKSMKSLVGKRLPNFTKEQSELVKGSFDFLGFNYYTTNYAQYTPPPNANRATYFSDARTILSTKRNGVPIGPIAASPWLAVYPRGIHDALLYIKAKYNNPVIYITENGTLTTRFSYKFCLR